MSINRIGKGAGIPPTTTPLIDAPSATSRPFSLEAPAPQAVQGATTEGLSPAEQVRRQEISLDTYLDLHIKKATSHLEKHLAPVDLERIQQTLREQMAHDPTLIEMVRNAAGVTPPTREG